MAGVQKIAAEISHGWGAEKLPFFATNLEKRTLIARAAALSKYA